jgi:hypothetical protein
MQPYASTHLLQHPKTRIKKASHRVALFFGNYCLKKLVATLGFISLYRNTGTN